MGKIDDWKRAKNESDAIRRFADEVADTKHADKFYATVSIDNTALGYYGNSSVHRWDERVVEAMENAIRSRLREVAQWAASDAESLTESYRLAAQGEAKEVLNELS